jgi:hypothetical protein
MRQVVIRQGEPCEDLFFVHTGQCRLIRHHDFTPSELADASIIFARGQEAAVSGDFLLRTLGPGDYFACKASEEYPHERLARESLVATTAALLVYLPRAEMKLHLPAATLKALEAGCELRDVWHASMFKREAAKFLAKFRHKPPPPPLPAHINAITRAEPSGAALYARTPPLPPIVGARAGGRADGPRAVSAAEHMPSELEGEGGEDGAPGERAAARPRAVFCSEQTQAKGLAQLILGCTKSNIAVDRSEKRIQIQPLGCKTTPSLRSLLMLCAPPAAHRTLDRTRSRAAHTAAGENGAARSSTCPPLASLSPTGSTAKLSSQRHRHGQVSTRGAAGRGHTSPLMDTLHAELVASTQRANAAADTCVDFSLTLGAPLRPRVRHDRRREWPTSAPTSPTSAPGLHRPRIPSFYSDFYVFKYKNR